MDKKQPVKTVSVEIAYAEERNMADYRVEYRDDAGAVFIVDKILYTPRQEMNYGYSIYTVGGGFIPAVDGEELLTFWAKETDATNDTPPDRDLAAGEAPCVICMDDATKLYQGYSLCDDHAKRMAAGFTYDELLIIQDQQTELDVINERLTARHQHSEFIREKTDSYLRSLSDEDLQLWARFASTTWNGQESHKRIQDEIERRKQEATKPDDADDLAHDLDVIIFAGIYMDGDDAESMRSEAGLEAYNAIRIGVDQMRGKAFELESILHDLLSYPHAWTYHKQGSPRTCGYCTHELSDHEPDCPIKRAQSLLSPSKETTVNNTSALKLGAMQQLLLTQLLTEHEVSTVNFHWTRDVQPLIKAGYITVREIEPHGFPVHLSTITDLGRQAIAAQPDPLAPLKDV